MPEQTERYLTAPTNRDHHRGTEAQRTRVVRASRNQNWFLLCASVPLCLCGDLILPKTQAGFARRELDLALAGGAPRLPLLGAGAMVRGSSRVRAPGTSYKIA